MSFEIIELENQKNQVLIDENNEKLLCPECKKEVAERDALIEMDVPVPKFCQNCGHKLHYSSRVASNSTDNKMGVIFVHPAKGGDDDDT